MNRKSEFCLPQLAIVTGAPGWLGSSLITALIKGRPACFIKGIRARHSRAGLKGKRYWRIAIS